MYKIVHVQPKPGYVLQLTFEDGMYGEVCIADRLFGPMFEPLKDADFFARVEIDEFGALFWPNDADLAPDGLYKKLCLAVAGSSTTSPNG